MARRQWDPSNAAGSESSVASRLQACEDSLHAIVGVASEWPESIPSAFAAREFRDAVETSITAAGVTGPVTYHCDEFPCIAILPAETSSELSREVASGLKNTYPPEIAANLGRRAAFGVGDGSVRRIDVIAFAPIGSSEVERRLSWRVKDEVDQVEREAAQRADHLAAVCRDETPPPAWCPHLAE